MIKAYVFVYGSLVSEDDHLRRATDEASFGYLSGYRRTWNVAFENRSPQRDHKFYVNRSGQRVSGAVAALGIEFARRSRVFGMALPVDDWLLHLLDKRELAYERSEDLRNSFSLPLPAPLYTYLPLPRSEKTFWSSLRAEDVYLPADYYREVRRAFRLAGYEQEFLSTTAPPHCPLADIHLQRRAGLEGI